MMTVTAEPAARRRTVKPSGTAARAATGTGTCAACRLTQPAASLEPVPTRPGLRRCKDAAACCERFRPRPLASSAVRPR